MRTRLAWIVGAILLLITTVYTAIAAPAVVAQWRSRNSASYAWLRTVVKTEMASQRAPGLAVAVVYGGKLVFAEGFGVRNTDTNDAVTPATLFRIGSTTKPLTAHA